MTTSEAGYIQQEVRIAASPDTIFPFLIDPSQMMRWKGIEAELDPTPGGIYRVNVTGSDIARGEYVEVSPNTKVVFTWGFEGDPGLPPGSSTVEISLIPEGDETLVRLRHYGLEGERRKSHTEGWVHYTERLKVVAEGGDAGVDPVTQPKE